MRFVSLLAERVVMDNMSRIKKAIKDMSLILQAERLANKMTWEQFIAHCEEWREEL